MVKRGGGGKGEGRKNMYKKIFAQRHQPEFSSTLLYFLHTLSFCFFQDHSCNDILSSLDLKHGLRKKRSIFIKTKGVFEIFGKQRKWKTL
jgi:hypothetical protein